MMKNTFYLFLLFSSFTFAQHENFSIVKKQLEWQRIYKSTLAKSEIKNNIKRSGKLTITSETENVVYGSFKNVTGDYVGAGLTTLDAADYIKDSSISANFKINLKNGYYTVTLNKIMTQELIEALPSTANNKIPLEKHALNEGEEKFKESFEMVDSKIFNYTFTGLFDITQYKK
jgi:hypothetical protein